MERKDLYYVLFEQQKDFESMKNLIDRERTSEFISKIHLQMPIILTGVRRCGKSSLLKIIKDKLMLNQKQYLYINFNDERLIHFSIDDFQKIIDFLEENDYSKNCILFIDEIQETKAWEKWIDRIKSKYRIIITGSNSKLLSSEISTILTGRSISFSLYPFNFKEFLNYKKINLNTWKLDLKLHSKIRKLFDNYLNLGGFPKFVITNEKIIISELYENILYRDIIKRFNPNLVKPIKEISFYLVSNITSDISLRTLSRISNIKNLATVKSIIHSFEDSFLFFSINKFDYSIKKQTQNPKKIYCIDNGFGTSVGFKFLENKGKLMENLVAIELRRRGKEIYYFRENNECDFIIKKGLKIIELIQVCYDLNQANEKREFAGLLEAMNKFKLKHGLILTYDQEGERKINGNKIKLVPLWKWLLKNNSH